MTFLNSINVPNQYLNQRSFDQFEEFKPELYYRSFRERDYGTTFQTIGAGALNLVVDLFGPDDAVFEMAQGFEPDPTNIFDPDAYSDEPVDFRTQVPRVRKIDSEGNQLPAGNREIDFVDVLGLEPSGSNTLGYFQAGEALQVRMHGENMHGAFGRDAAAYAYRKRLLGQLQRTYGDVIDAGEETFGAPEASQESWTEHLAGKLDKILQDCGSLLGTAVMGTSSSDDIIEALTHDEKDGRYISDLDGSFLAEKYFNDTYANITPLISVLDRHQFDINEVRRLKNTEQVDYLMARTLSMSTLTDSLNKYYEESILGEFGFTIANLPNLIINDPDAQLAVLLAIGTAGRGSGGLIGAVGTAASRATARASLKAGLKAGSRPVVNFSKEAFKEGLPVAVGTRVSKVFSRAGKQNAFTRYLSAGFRVNNPVSKLVILDKFAKVGALGMGQGGVSDYFSQLDAVYEADTLGSASLYDKDISYQRVAIAAAASFVIGGGIGAGASALGRTLSRTKYRNPNQVAPGETGREGVNALNIVDETSSRNGRDTLEGRTPDEEGNASAVVDKAEADESARSAVTRANKTAKRNLKATYAAVQKISGPAGAFKKAKIRKAEEIKEAQKKNEESAQVAKDSNLLIRKAQETVKRAKARLAEQAKAVNRFSFKNGILRRNGEDVNSLSPEVQTSLRNQYKDLFEAYDNLQNAIELEGRATREAFKASSTAAAKAQQASRRAGIPDVTVRPEKASQPTSTTLRDQIVQSKKITPEDVQEKITEVDTIENRVAGTENKTTSSKGKRLKRVKNEKATLGRVPKERLQKIADRETGKGKKKGDSSKTFDIITEVRPTVKEGKFGPNEVMFNTFTLKDVLDELKSREEVGTKANESGTVVRLNESNAQSGLPKGPSNTHVVVDEADLRHVFTRGERKARRKQKRLLKGLSKTQTRKAKKAIDSKEYFASLSDGHEALNNYMELTAALMPGLNESARAIIRGMIATEPNADFYLQNAIFRRYDKKAIRAREKLLKLIQESDDNDSMVLRDIPGGPDANRFPMSKLQTLLDMLYVSSEANRVDILKRATKKEGSGGSITYTLHPEDAMFIRALTALDEDGGFRSGYILNETISLRGKSGNKVNGRIISLFNDRDNRFSFRNPEGEILEKAHVFIHEIAGHGLEYEAEFMASPLVNAYYNAVMRDPLLRDAHTALMERFKGVGFVNSARYATITAQEFFAEMSTALLNAQFSKADLFDYIAKSSFDGLPTGIKASMLSILDSIIDKMSEKVAEINYQIVDKIDAITSMLKSQDKINSVELEAVKLSDNSYTSFDKMLNDFGKMRELINNRLEQSKAEYKYLTATTAAELRYIMQEQGGMHDVMHSMWEESLAKLSKEDEAKYDEIYEIIIADILKTDNLTRAQMISRSFNPDTNDSAALKEAVRHLQAFLSYKIRHLQISTVKEFTMLAEGGSVASLIRNANLNKILPEQALIRIALDPLRARAEIYSLAVHGMDGNPKAFKLTADELMADMIESAYYASEEQAGVYWSRDYFQFRTTREQELYYTSGAVRLEGPLQSRIDDIETDFLRNLRIIESIDEMKKLNKFNRVLDNWLFPDSDDANFVRMIDGEELPYDMVKYMYHAGGNLTNRASLSQPRILFINKHKPEDLENGVFFTSKPVDPDETVSFYSRGVIYTPPEQRYHSSNIRNLFLQETLRPDEYLRLTVNNIDSYMEYRLKVEESFVDESLSIMAQQAEVLSAYKFLLELDSGQSYTKEIKKAIKELEKTKELDYGTVKKYTQDVNQKLDDIGTILKRELAEDPVDGFSKLFTQVVKRGRRGEGGVVTSIKFDEADEIVNGIMFHADDSNVKTTDQLTKEVLASKADSAKAKNSLTLRSTRQNAFMDSMSESVRSDDSGKAPEDIIIENTEKAQKAAEEAELGRQSDKIAENTGDDVIVKLDDGSIDFSSQSLAVTLFNLETRLKGFVFGKYRSHTLADEAHSAALEKILDGSVKPSPEQTTSNSKLISFFVKTVDNLAKTEMDQSRRAQMDEDVQQQASHVAAEASESIIDGDHIGFMLEQLITYGNIITGDEAIAFREYNDYKVRKQYITKEKDTLRSLNKSDNKDLARMKEISDDIKETEKLPTDIEGLIKFVNSKTKKQFTKSTFTKARNKVNDAIETNFTFNKTQNLIKWVGTRQQEAKENGTIGSLKDSQLPDNSPTSARPVNVDDADPTTPFDSTTENINQKAVEEAETGKSIRAIINETSERRGLVSGTDSRKEASVRQADQPSDVNKVSEVSLNNPLVIKDSMTELEISTLISEIPDDQIFTLKGTEQQYRGSKVKEIISNSLRSLLEIKPRSTFDDALYVVQGLLDQYNVADGIVVIAPINRDSPRMKTIKVITSPENKTEIKQEVKSDTGKVEDTSIKPAEDSKFKDEEGNEPEIDELDEHILDEEGYSAEVQPIKETDPTIKHLDEMSMEDRLSHEFLSDDAYLNDLGTDVVTVKNLVEHLEDTDYPMSSWDKLSEVISAFLNEAYKIREANAKVFGEDSNDFFWRTVRELRKRRDVKQRQLISTEEPDLTLQLEASRVDEDIFKIAASRTQARAKRIDTISGGELGREIPKDATFEVPLTPEVFRPTEAKKKLYREREAIENDDVDIQAKMDESDKLIEDFVSARDGDNTRYIRAQGLVGALFGGADSSSQGWYRQAMSNIVIYSHFGLGLADTIYSHVPIMQALTKFMDSTKAHTGHVINSGKPYIKTWMQSEADAKTFIGMISSENTRILKALPMFNKKAYPEIMEFIYDARLYKEDGGGMLTKENLKEILLRNGVKEEDAEVRAAKLEVVVNEYNDVLTYVYEQFFKLQEETGWKDYKETAGDLNPRHYAPIVIDPNVVEGNIPDFITQATKSRRKTLAENTLSIHKPIAYALGWLPTTAVREKSLSNIFARKKGMSENRQLLNRPAMETTLGRQTLNILGFNDSNRRYRMDPTKDVEAFKEVHGVLGRDFWVLRDGEEFVVLRMIKDIEKDLSPADRNKYYKAVKGITDDYIPSIKKMVEDSGNDDIIMQEMAELTAFKLGQGIYGNKNTAKRNYQPILGFGDPDKVRVGTWVKNLQPDEVLNNPDLKKYLQTNPTLSSTDFLRGRLFELLAQRELDRMLGGTGVRMHEFLSKAFSIAERNIINAKHTPEMQKELLSSLTAGMELVRQKYAQAAGTLTSVNDKYSGMLKHFYAFSKNLVQVGSSPMFGTAALVEVLKAHGSYGDTGAGKGLNPTAIIRNSALFLRSVIGDLRYNKAATTEGLRDTIFAFDTLNRNGSMRFFKESDESLHLSLNWKTNLFGPKGGNLPDHIKNAPFGIGKGQLLATKVAHLATEVGSLQQVTDASRQISIVHWKDTLVKYITKGKLNNLVEAMSRQEVMNKLESLEAAAALDRSKQAELVKYVKTIARESGFGGSYEDAMIFFKYGLTEPKIADALRLALGEMNINNGRFDFRDMLNYYLRIRNGRRAGGTEDFAESFHEGMNRLRYAVEQLVITRDISEPQGLSVQTGLQARTDFGRLFNQLFSWVQSFQSNLVNSYGDRGTLSFLVGSLTMFGVSSLVVMTFREWIRGRDIEDILQEAEEDPIKFIASATASVPVMGRFNTIFEGLVNSIAMALGSEGNKVYPAMGTPGITAVSSATRDIYKAGEETVNLLRGESNTPTERIVAKYLKASQLDSFVNNSPLAIPARVMEELDLINDRGQVKDYLDAIKRDGNRIPKKDRAANIERPNITLPNNNSIKNKLKEDKMARESLNRFLAEPTATPVQALEETTEEYREKLGGPFYEPPQPQATPSPSEPKESLSGPSRASQKVADILEDGTE